MLRDRIRKLVVVIRKLGQEPVEPRGAEIAEYSKAIRQQYAQLRAEWGAEAMREAWKQAQIAIVTMGLAKAASPMPNIMPTSPANWKYVRKKAVLLKARCDANPEQAHLCPKCRMRCGVPKISWHSRELAEQSRTRSREDTRLLKVYECPHEPGNWHLGHKRNTLNQTRAGRKQ